MWRGEVFVFEEGDASLSLTRDHKAMAQWQEDITIIAILFNLHSFETIRSSHFTPSQNKEKIFLGPSPGAQGKRATKEKQ